MTKGDATEAAVLAALVRSGHLVLRPFSASAPYDLAVDAGDRLVRVQCKTGRVRGGSLVFNSCGTDHGRGRQCYAGRADVFGVACPEHEAVYIVPVDDAAGFATALRLEPARNNQRRGVRMAERYRVEAWAPSTAAA